ncbi:surface lipoprotein assembly modifier [Acinetobacter sp.]|uniref:surface lipoprotein assembly modifier n=1 Tax=Acinetobacter sp. TaxID=472 RepID=UPI0035B0F13F
MKKNSIIFILTAISPFLHAADNDTRLRLDQELLQQKIEQQQPFIQQQQADQLPAMVIDGETIKVEKNLNDVGRALYIAVMQKQWQAASIYLDSYLKLEGYDPSLAHFAQGALARMQGQPQQAEQHFQQALALQPQNSMIKLELARLLTERQKNKEAKQLFQQVKDQLAQSADPSVQNIGKTVDLYLNGLKQRDAWQGSVSAGTRYAANINSSSEQTATWTIYAEDGNGNKVPVQQVTRGTPAQINAAALDYEAALSKRWSMQSNHGIALKAFGYGRAYDSRKDYNETTLNFNAGYSYQDQRNQLLIVPVYEHRRVQNESLSNAWGARAEWMRFIGQDKAFKLEAEIKDIDNVKYSTQSGMENSVFSTFWKVLPQQWTLFGGLDYVDHNSEEQYFTAYEQQGVRLGLSKQFKEAGFNAALFSSYRWRQYDKYNSVLEEKRQDFEQNYTLVFSAPKWELYGLTPNLTYQYNKNRSNVDWLYSYDKHNVSLKLERRF